MAHAACEAQLRGVIKSILHSSLLPGTQLVVAATLVAEGEGAGLGAGVRAALINCTLLALLDGGLPLRSLCAAGSEGGCVVVVDGAGQRLMVHVEDGPPLAMLPSLLGEATSAALRRLHFLRLTAQAKVLHALH